MNFFEYNNNSLSNIRRKLLDNKSKCDSLTF